MLPINFRTIVRKEREKIGGGNIKIYRDNAND